VILYLIFLLSGVAGLIYQIIWVRQFGNVFGNTIHSAALVITVFMLGLGAGSWIAGLWADRRWARQPGSLLTTYARVKVGIALAGLAIACVMPRLGDIAAVAS
jgi:spermidine synthase